MKETYTITGMTCAACSARVEKSVAALPGTKDVSVNLLKNSMVVEYDEAKLSSAEIVQAVTKAGYGAALRDAAKAGKAPSPAEAARQEYLAMKRRMTGSFLFAIPLFYLSMGRMMGWPMPEAFLGDSRAMVCALTELFLLIPHRPRYGRSCRSGPFLPRALLRGSRHDPHAHHGGEISRSPCERPHVAGGE